MIEFILFVMVYFFIAFGIGNFTHFHKLRGLLQVSTGVLLAFILANFFILR